MIPSPVQLKSLPLLFLFVLLDTSSPSLDYVLQLSPLTQCSACEPSQSIFVQELQLLFPAQSVCQLVLGGPSPQFHAQVPQNLQALADTFPVLSPLLFIRSLLW